MGKGGTSSRPGGGVLPFRPNERALLAREAKDGGCGSGCGATAGLLDDENIGAVARLVGNKSSSSSGSRSGSSDEGSVEVELYRAEAPEES